MDILGVLITCFVATSILDMSDIASVFVGSTNPTQRGDVSHHTPLVNAAGAF